MSRETGQRLLSVGLDQLDQTPYEALDLLVKHRGNKGIDVVPQVDHQVHEHQIERVRRLQDRDRATKVIRDR